MTVHRFILAGSLLVFGLVVLDLPAADEVKDSPKGAATRKKLKQKVTLDFKNEQVQNIIEEIKEQIKDLTIRVDTKGGVSMNRRMSIKCKDTTLEEALDKMLGKEELGYIVISDSKNAYDGSIFIKMGKERGYPAGQEPKKDK